MKWEFGPKEPCGEQMRAAFRVFGFVVVRGAIDPQEVTALRSELDRAFDNGSLFDPSRMCSTELLEREPIWRYLFKDRIVNPLRAVLGPELYYQNDLHVQRNSFGQAGLQRHRGWHMDAGSETHNGYLRSQHYRFAKCGIFLQAFDNGWGGGIRVKPKSHRRLFEPNLLKRNFFFLRRVLNRAAIRLRMDLDTLEVPTRAGDLCFFDSRLLHSSVLPSCVNVKRLGYDRKEDVGSFWSDIPAQHTKYVMYWDACNRAMVEDFLRNSIRRSEAERSGVHERPGRPAVFTRFLSVRYPDDYPTEFVEAATGAQVAVATLDAERATLYKQQLQSMRSWQPT
jgi:hypothetical protein